MSFGPVSLGLSVLFTLAQAFAPTSSAEFADVVHEHFADWDLNHDGKIEGSEIDKLMTRRGIRGKAAAALAVLKVRERRTPAAVRRGFTLSPEDVDGLDKLADPVPLDPAKPAKPFHSEAQFKQYAKTLHSLVPKLYAGSGPDFSAMKQGPIGDCYFFCMTGFLAAKHPNKIRQMIHTAPNGLYTVKFLDGETFTINTPSDAELLINNSSSSLADGLWLCILEKALGQRLRARTKDPAKKTAEPTDAMASGGNMVTVMTLYSGHKIKSIKVRDPQHASERLREIRQELPTTLAQGRMAGVGMAGVRAGLQKVPSWGYNHAYAILAFDPESDRVTVWNPWGQDFQPKGPEGAEHGFVTKHGIFHVPLTTLYRHFSAVHLETTERATIDPPKPKPSGHK